MGFNPSQSNSPVKMDVDDDDDDDDDDVRDRRSMTID